MIHPTHYNLQFLGWWINCLVTPWSINDRAQSQLVICKEPHGLTKDTFWEFLWLTVSRKLKNHPFFVGHCECHEWVGRSKIIWVVNLNMVIKNLQNVYKIFWWPSHVASKFTLLCVNLIVSRWVFFVKLRSPVVWLFDIWHHFDILISFTHFDILTHD